MADYTTTRTDIPVPTAETILSLCACIVTRSGHTLSWYTSRKGRVWITLKGFTPTVYSTSTECVQSVPDSEMLDTFAVLMAHHLPKLQGDVPPLTTWVTRKDITDTLHSSIEYLNTVWERWQHGENIWAQDDVLSAPVPPLEEDDV